MDYWALKETGTLRVELLDQSSIIREGDQIRITSNSGIPYVGRYAGEDAEFFRIKYPNGDTLRFKKSDFNLDTIIGEGDAVTLRSKSGNSYSGQYVSEADGYIVLRDESGNAFRLRSEMVDKTSIKTLGMEEQSIKNKNKALFADKEEFPSQSKDVHAKIYL